MKSTNQTLKQIYYAITSALLIPIILWIIGNPVTIVIAHEVITIILVLLIAIVFIWIATIHNNKSERNIYLSIIFFTFIIALGWYLMNAYHLKMTSHNTSFFNHYSHIKWDVFKSSLICVCCAVIMTAEFRSKTKYYNILPKQSKTVNWIFRILSWIGQIIVWAVFIFIIFVMIKNFKMFS